CVKLPEGLMTIESDLFRYDGNLENCNIPQSVLVIKDRAFGYTGMREITIPMNVEVLGSEGVNEGIFLGCANLKKIRIESKKLKTINKGSFSGLPENVVIEVPMGYREIYEMKIKDSFADSESPKKYNVVEVDVPDNGDTCIQLNRKSITMKRGLSYKLSLMYADESEDVTWITDDAQIASVDETGLVMANEIGQTKISARYKGKTYECNVVVEIEDSNNDAKFLKKLIKKQNKDGGDVYMSSNIKDKDQYTWENGRLVSIDWGDRGAHGFIDLNEFTYLRSFRCDGNNSYVRGIEADNLRFLKEIYCSSDVPDGNIHVENSKNVVVNKKCPY
nr:leucine-rich repeat protein [Lachnospiraceae bacterium]